MGYQPDKFHLDSVHATLTLPRRGLDLPARLHVAGRSMYARANLWNYEEEWDERHPTTDLAPVDALHWVILAVWQDRPTAPYQLNRSLRGEPLWDQLELDL